MSKEGNFLVYCMERYRYAKKLSGREISEIFDRYNVYDYIVKYFETLHTIGDKLIVNDIDEYISEKNA